MTVRMRHTHAQSAQRRSHHALSEPRLSKCGNCGAMHRRHMMCAACGQYRGKAVVDVTLKAKRRAEKIKARAKASGESVRSESSNATA